MKVENIVLISIGYFETNILEKVLHEVEHEFMVPVRIKEGHLDLSEYYNPARNQYDANKLLKEIDATFASNQDKTLGIFDVDLFIPILTYIFGQAFLNGRSGIASLYRLRNERYGIKSDEKIFVDRIRKEIIHELGHSFGLIHCSNPTCVMRSSTYVEDIDQKNHHFCNTCRAELAKNETAGK